jgi:hypothetical protein
MTREEAYKTLTEKLIAAGHKVDLNSLRMVDDTYISLECHEETQTGSYSYKKNGKLRLIVGGYGDKRQFPQTKDGGFNWDKIVKVIESKVAQRKADDARSAKAQSRREQADVECSQLRAVYGLKEYYGFLQVSPCDQGIELRVNKGITKEQAEVLIKAAKEAGLI